MVAGQKQAEAEQGSSDAQREAPRFRHAPTRGPEALDQRHRLDQGGQERNPEEQEGERTEAGEPSWTPAWGSPFVIGFFSISHHP